ncbi:MAG TPA: glucose-6-phosphate isomerase [Thermohalobaculum sp.]|nr:glucose-6-phosphate isomerase [Thermohalobaculum sp.]
MTLESIWQRVHHEAARLKPVHLCDLFAQDQSRFAALSANLDDLLVDFSKEKIDTAALAALLTLARAAEVEVKRDAMLAGEPVNITEGRAVLHTALRSGAGARILVDGIDVVPAIHKTLDRFLAFAEDLRTGRYASQSGAPFTDVVAIGIGGSALGPEMATLALAPWHDGPRLHFVSNVDGAHLTDTLKPLDPARTLVIVASKSFTTQETMTNAASARAWLAGALGDAAGCHIAAASTNLAATRDFGIDDRRVFGFWDWVGGRFSTWSAIGLPLAIAIGAANFRAFLDGALQMDDHFRFAPLERNLPVLLALIGIWRRNAMGWPTTALVPYDQRLARLPAYVQQVELESNGKRIGRDNRPVSMATAAVVWGEPGTNSQHSFFQLIHQGTDTIPVDFLLAAVPQEQIGDHHAQLAANALAQSAALAFGKDEDAVRAKMALSGVEPGQIDRLAPHRTFPGDRPSTTILYRRLDPATLGRLMALFEHKVAVQGAVWNINSFDQWGVELGKELAARLLPSVLGSAGTEGLDASTAGLLAHYAALRAKAAN